MIRKMGPPVSRVTAALILILLLPLLLLIALVVRLSSRGPAIYRGWRVGLHGETFKIHKFRTMRYCADAPEADAPERVTGPGGVITGYSDPRVLKLGKVLRRTKLDELPQLFDIARGRMAFVGPRPEDPLIVERYYTTEMLETLTIRPGLTSPGAIAGSLMSIRLEGGGTPEQAYVEQILEEKLAIERAYMKRKSLSYDATVLVRTAHLLLHQVIGIGTGPKFPELSSDSYDT